MPKFLEFRLFRVSVQVSDPGFRSSLITDLIATIILGYLKKTVYNLFTITTNIQEGVL